MNARYPYLLALALALPLASCRFVGMKPDFSVLGDALTPPQPDHVAVESKPGRATPITGYQAPAPPPVVPAAPPAAAGKDTSSFFSQQQVSRPIAQVQQPGSRPATRPAGRAAAASSADTYTVLPGDSLARIARIHQVPLGRLAAVNGISLSNPLIKPGQQLRIPRGGAAIVAPPQSLLPTTPRPAAPPAPRPAASPAPATTPHPLLTLKPVSNAAPAASPPPAATAAPAPKGHYRVAQGDTLYRIARRHGLTLQELLQANNIDAAGAHRVRVGTLLIIPAKQ